MNISLTIPHTLVKTEALRRIKDLLTKLQQEHANQFSDPKETWTNYVCSFSFKIQGSDVSGSLEVKEGFIAIKGDLPLFLRILKGRIESMITEKAKELLR